MRMRWMAIAAAATGLVSVAACARGPANGAQIENASGHAVLLANTGQARATLEIASGATAITIGTADSNGPLVRASAPKHANIRPVIKDGRVITVTLRHTTGQPAPATLHVYLNDAVRWRLVIGGGAVGLVLNLRSAHLRATDIIAGFTAITMWLPRPAGTGTVTLAGGASRVQLVLPHGVPARLRLDGGAGHATVAGRTYAGVAGGTVLTAPGWAGAPGRYQVDAPAGLSSISVTSTSPPAS
ncbi:MAG TPA: hypothetical protein VGM14_06185 [Streptosporangiaceae bacterium]